MPTAVPRIAFTPGEPAGIGPDLSVHLLDGVPDAELVLIGDARMLAQRARNLGRTPCEEPFIMGDDAPPRAGGVRILDRALNTPAQPGRLDPANARYVLDTLATACNGCLDGTFSALVTGPVHKGVINEAGIAFTGHTEYLADYSGGHPVMMLTCPGLRVALATTHVPLCKVAERITTERLERVIRALHRDLVSRFGLPTPRVLVCGLNPHAGEDGHLGSEDEEIIKPLLRRLRNEGMILEGPLPADTLFTPDNLARADAVLAMYHDQGLPVLKHMGFGQAVNITLGLPIIRTSVDHGTALDLAGSDRANPGSLNAAIRAAILLSAGSLSVRAG